MGVYGETGVREEGGRERKREEGSSWRQKAAIKPAPWRRVDRDVFKTYSSIRTDTPTPLRSTYRGFSLSPQFLLCSPPLLPRFHSLSLSFCVVFFFLSGERPVKSTVYYVFRPHPDKNTRHARTTHSALFLYLSYRPYLLPTICSAFLPFSFKPTRQEPGFTTLGAFRFSRFRIVGRERRSERGSDPCESAEP